MRKSLNRAAIVIMILVTMISCRHNPYTVNLNGIECNIEFRNLAGDIFETPPNELLERADTLKAEYGKALEVYSSVIGLGNPSDENWDPAFVMFASDLQNLALYDEVKKVWGDMGPLEAQLQSAFRYYKYYFPEKIIPEVIFCISAFNNSIIVDDSLLMVSLDRYLGADSKYYPGLGIYKYQARRMTPEYTASDCMYAWASTEWDYKDMNYGARTLLNTMLHEASLVYFTRCVMPSVPDTILFGFTGKQLDFCRENEALMWDYMVSNDLLFSTESFMIRKFTGEAPFTSYFTEDSPGRAVIWTGFRIIERYMRNNPEVSLSTLMKMNDCQAILSGAKYNP